METLFGAVIRRFGRQMTTASDPVFHTTAAQRSVIVELEEIGCLFARKDSVHTVFREAMPKSMYWLGTSILTNHLISNLWPACLRSNVPEDFPVVVSNECVQFMLKRYLSGQAILSVTWNEQAWVPRRPDDFREPDDMLPLLLRILRGAQGSVITRDHIFCADLALKRSIEKGSDTVAHVAQQRITAIWQQLRDLGLGEIRAHGQSVQFHKYHVASLKPSCLDWLRKHRVPVSHFGPRARVDHSAFLRGRCPPDMDVEPVHPVVDPDMSSVPAQAAEQNPAGKTKDEKVCCNGAIALTLVPRYCPTSSFCSTSATDPNGVLLKCLAVHCGKRTYSD